MLQKSPKGAHNVCELKQTIIGIVILVLTLGVVGLLTCVFKTSGMQ